MAKTIKIEAIKAKANQYMRESANEMREGRKGLGVFVSSLLMEANAYKGFSYLSADQLPAKSTVGIVRHQDGTAIAFPDDSRIAYH